MDKIKTVQQENYVKTLCCEKTGRLMVVYDRDKTIKYAYCSECLTACDGSLNVIGKHPINIPNA
jgi:hypothetical protein